MFFEVSGKWKAVSNLGGRACLVVQQNQDNIKMEAYSHKGEAFWWFQGIIHGVHINGHFLHADGDSGGGQYLLVDGNNMIGFLQHSSGFIEHQSLSRE